jgi:hypothetical protein
MAKFLRSTWPTLLLIAVLIAVVTAQARNQTSYVSEAISRITEGPGTSVGVRDLSSVAQLQTQFNADEGRPRLILLLSPT